MEGLQTKEIQLVERNFDDISTVIVEIGGDIASHEQYEMAMMAMKQLKEIKTRWVALFDSIREKQVAALDEVYATINRIKNPCDTHIKALTPRVFAWERKLEADAKRLELELQMKAKKEAEDRALEEAAQHHANGRKDLAETVLMTPMAPVPTIAVTPLSRPVAGLNRRTVWKGRVTDFKALVKAVAEGRAPSHLLALDQTEANKLASALKGEMRIDGLEAYEDAAYAKGR